MGNIDLVSVKAMYKLLKTCQTLCKSKYATASNGNFLLQKLFFFLICVSFYSTMHEYNILRSTSIKSFVQIAK